MQNKKKSYKKGIEHDEARRKRTETTVQIRKEKKEDQLLKRRSVITKCFLDITFVTKQMIKILIIVRC